MRFASLIGGKVRVDGREVQDSVKLCFGKKDSQGVIVDEDNSNAYMTDTQPDLEELLVNCKSLIEVNEVLVDFILSSCLPSIDPTLFNTNGNLIKDQFTAIKVELSEFKERLL